MNIYLHLLICLLLIICSRVNCKRKNRLRNSSSRNVELRSLEVAVNAKANWLHVSRSDIKDEKKKKHNTNKRHHTQGRKHHGLALDKADKILAIKDDAQFAEKVYEMMKNDDSDVLKDIDEDEDLVFLQTRKQKQKATAKHKHLKRGKKHYKATKRHRTKIGRNSVTKRSQIYNMTMPSETMPSNTMPVNTMPSDPMSTNTMPTNTMPDNTMPDNTMPVNTMNTMPIDATNYQNNGVEMMASPAVNVKATQSIPDTKPLLQAIETSVEEDGNFIKSSRICKPGPPQASNNRTPNCLLIGDSITAGYSYAVAAALQGRCVVQLSPFSKAGCGLDSRYGLQCIPLFLSTTNLSPTRYDVISFNFGMHDIDYSSHFPEEFNDEHKYQRNLGRIKKILQKTGAGVLYVSTTPVSFNTEKNDLVIKYNTIAERVMSKSPSVDTVDLYDYVIDKCGKIPYKNCSIMKKPEDVHYNVEGSILLGKQVAAKIAEILKERKLWVEPGYSLPDDVTLPKPLFYLKEDSIKCSTNATVPTRCPSETTCVPNAISKSGYACCMVENGVDCKDNFHCCPEKTICHKKCNPRWCKCIPA